LQSGIEGSHSVLICMEKSIFLLAL
jgi:hypothetical protein